MHKQSEFIISKVQVKHKPDYLILLFLLFNIMMFLLMVLFNSSWLFADNTSKLLDSLNSKNTIYFGFGKYEIKAETYPALEDLARELKSNPGQILTLEGFTDDIGSNEFNLNLSEKRANAVKEFLISKGCNTNNIIIKANGEENSLNNNTTELEREENRRVKFSLSKSIEKEKENDLTYVNSSVKIESREEITTNISVRDTSGEPIEGLTENDISATLKWEQDNKQDSAAGYTRLIPIDDKKKIAFTLTMDYSPSMYDSNFSMKAPKTEKILAMEKAVTAFINNIDSKHIVRIIKFGSVINIIQPYTKSKELMLSAIQNASYPRPGTALFKSIYVALNDTLYNSNPTVMKTVIAFTDGEENASGNINKDSIYRLSEFKGVKVYTVGLINPEKHSTPLGLNSKDEADLLEISQRTGGFYWWAKNSDNLPAIYTQVLNQIMKSYQVSILWEKENLPPKGTKVIAVIKVNVKGRIRTIYKDYIME